jgi:hypothetical protein
MIGEIFYSVLSEVFVKFKKSYIGQKIQELLFSAEIAFSPNPCEGKINNK